MPRTRTIDTRTAVGLLAPIFLMMLVASTARAQMMANPRFVKFFPSVDHNTIGSSGQPVVASYQVLIYQVGALQPMLTLDLGKPGPEQDGYIVANLSNLLAGPLASGSQLEARIAAKGAGGSAVSALSNTFVFNGCSAAVTPAAVPMPSAGGNAILSVSVASGCGWQATSDAGWVAITSGSAGSGNGAVGISAAANSTTTSRTGLLSVAGQTVTVSQDAGSGIQPPPPPPPPPSDVPPTVQLTGPGAGASYVAGSAIDMTATAADSDGTVTRVDFYANGTLLGSSSATPYAFCWTGARAGSYSLSAVATDNAGLQATSTTVSVSVKKKHQR